jgi:hypothetical protein
MQTLIVLFRLKPGAHVAAYEAWARSTDLPIVRQLPSVTRFDVYKSHGLYGSSAAAPYDYIEMIDISDPQRFGGDVSTPTMQKVAGEFRQFADNPLFIVTERMG